MPSYNRVILMGNLTRDPELQHTPNGTPVCEFSVAVNRTWTDKSTGQKREEVGFFECVAWGRTGEVVAEHLRKGRPVFVDGRLVQDRWEDKETGKARSKVKINVERVQFLGSKDGQAEARQPRQHPEDVGFDAGGSVEEDIPF